MLKICITLDEIWKSNFIFDDKSVCVY